MWVRDIREICAFVHGGVVRVRTGRTPKHRIIRQKTAPGYAVSDAERTDIPAQNHPGESGPREVLGQAPPPPTPKGSRRFTGHGRLAHTKPKKFRGGVKTARPVLWIPQQVSQGHSEALALWISFPPGKLETEGRSDKTAASCARGISLHPWYAGQLSAIHFWDRYTQIANRLGIWK